MALAGLPLLFFPRKYTALLIHSWSKLMLFLFKRFDGLNWVVIGEENIPNTPFIIASKHQSIWDTIFFTAYFSDAAMVLKKILIYLPAYGWHAVKAKMIWVDRKAKGKALKQLLKMAKECSSNNRPIVIFPEGTRVNVMTRGKGKGRSGGRSAPKNDRKANNQEKGKDEGHEHVRSGRGNLLPLAPNIFHGRRYFSAAPRRYSQKWFEGRRLTLRGQWMASSSA